MVQNFSALPEVGWNRDHSLFCFFLLQTSDFPVLDPNWTAQEEMSLLEAVMDCGFGNWWGFSGSANFSQWWAVFPLFFLDLTVEFISAHCSMTYCGWDTNLAAKVEGWSIRSCDHELPVFSFIKNSCVKSTEPQNPQKNWEFLGALCCQKTENWLQSLPLPGVSEMCEKLSNNNSRFKAVKDVVHCIRQRVSRMKTVNCSVHGHPKRAPWHCIKRVSVGAERVSSGTITGQFSAHNTTNLLSKITFSHWRN